MYRYSWYYMLHAMYCTSYIVNEPIISSGGPSGKNCFLELVSVLDSNINLTISKIELEKSLEWIPGWKDVSKTDSISKEYQCIKELLREENCKGVFINEDSPFNIS